jgi:hypothetical protein
MVLYLPWRMNDTCQLLFWSFYILLVLVFTSNGLSFFSSNLIALKLISTDVISLFNVSVNRGLYCIILRMDVLTLLQSD